MSDFGVWQLRFDLTQYTPAEAERITGLSTAMQRDWRHRGFGSRSGKQARFTIFDLAELHFMKAHSDQGKGPSLSLPYAARVAERIVATGLMWRGDAWTGELETELFDRIPAGSRSLTSSEHFDLELGKERDTLEPEDKRQWLAAQIYAAMGLDRQDGFGRQSIWWPTGEFELGDYEHKRFTGLGSDHKLARVDPKYDGPALVFDIEAAAEILVDRAPRPWLNVQLLVSSDGPPQSSGTRLNLGQVVVISGDKEVVWGAFKSRGASNVS